MKAKEVKGKVSWDWIRPETVSVRPDSTVKDALSRMATFGIHHLLVLKAGEYAGIVDARDALAREHETKGQAEVKVSHIMRADVPIIDENSDVQRAVELMLSSHSSALPIARGGKVTGILTETDLLRLLDSFLRQPPRPVDTLVERGEAILASPLLQNLLKALGDAGV